MKCDSCGNTLQETFLGKVLGTAVKKEGKTKWICSTCQSKKQER